MTLDGAGNITQSTMNLPLLPALPPSTGAMAYDITNRLISASAKSYTPDVAGRTITETKGATQTTYKFDINDHITSITRGGATLSSYGYDLKNNRISQIQNGVETRYVIDQLASLPNVIAETDALGTPQTYYIYGEGLVSQITAAGISHYYHYDPTGNTLALSDAAGKVTDTFAYAPYGFTTSTGTTHNPFKFVGRYGVMDDGNGLHYMRARYYKEDIKRFVSLDALHGDMMTPQKLNRYAYVLGNPVMGIDPSGYESQNGFDCKISSGVDCGYYYDDNLTKIKLGSFAVGFGNESHGTTIYGARASQVNLQYDDWGLNQFNGMMGLKIDRKNIGSSGIEVNSTFGLEGSIIEGTTPELNPGSYGIPIPISGSLGLSAGGGFSISLVTEYDNKRNLVPNKAGTKITAGPFSAKIKIGMSKEEVERNVFNKSESFNCWFFKKITSDKIFKQAMPQCSN